MSLKNYSLTCVLCSYHRFKKLPLMDPYGRHMTFIEYYLLDIMAITAAVVTVVVYVVFLAFRFVIRKCCGPKKIKFE